MSDIIDIKDEYKKNAYINTEKYEEMYKQSIEDPENFWAEQADKVDWTKKWDKVMDCNFNTADIKWYLGGKLNVTYNCIDRHLEKRGDQTAIIWESDNPNLDKSYTYKELHKEVSLFSNVLKKHNVKKGDVVIIYMPMIPELSIAVLACARIGAIHSVVFGGFSPDSLKSRILDCKPKLLICADRGVRGGKSVPSKSNADTAMEDTNVEKCIVVRRTDEDTNMLSGRDFWWDDETNDSSISDICPAEEMDAEDPLFILYTSGSTGQPKGVMHTTGGYIVYTTLTFKYVFDYKDGDIFWCTADIGWITGHSYIIYGPLSNGATSVMFEGVPQYPDWGRFWDVIDKHKVNIFYTAPTAIRAIARMGDHHVSKRKLDTLKLLGTVGEPINPEAWLWYYNVIGKSKLPIVDTWWQTETGGILISPLPGATKLKPGSATKPLFGIQPLIVDNEGNELKGAASGNLCLKSSWPGQMRGVYGDPKRFYNTYFTTYKGYYFTGDGCRRDEDGYYWITGRVDDVINVSGHRLGTAEIESALVLHKDVAESAVVGFHHDIKGQGIYAFVTLNQDVEPTDSLKKELVQQVRTQIGPIANLDNVQWAPALPKTRSGKIMRRILRKIAEKDLDNIGDTSTLAEPEVVDDLVKNAAK